MTYEIVRLFSLYYIAVFYEGVMQYSIYGGYKSLSIAKAIATRKGIKIDGYRL